MCQKMMVHCQENDHWIRGEGPQVTYKEIWDGTHFNELKWFWDPACEWMLPIRCNFCPAVISADEIQSSPHNEEDGSYSVQCEECGIQYNTDHSMYKENHVILL